MPTDRSGEPWSGVTYNGFSGTGPAAPQGEARRFEPHEHQRQPPAAPPRRGVSKRMLAGGVAVAASLGLLFGVLAKPDLVDGNRAREPMRPAAAPATEVAAAMPIEVAPVVAAPTPVATDRLEVLSPEVARAGAEPVRIPAARPLPRPVEFAEAPPPPIRAAPPADVARAPPAIPASAREPQPRLAERPVAPGFNCRYARSRSEQMVCSDDQLARLDRRLNAAFRSAVASGVPFEDLRADQDDWLAIREDAARHSPDAVRSIYRQRIRELEDMAG